MNEKGFINIITIIVIALVCVSAVGYLAFFKIPTGTTPQPITPEPEDPNPSPVFCTQEAKLCPDGSYVGRTGPRCEFTPCPNVPADSECTSNVDCKPGYTCIQRCGPPVARDNDPPQPYYCELDKYATEPRNCPICLSGGTMIDTPLGSISIKDLWIGMPVWTIDKFNNRVLGVIQETSRVPVPLTHRMVHFILDDGRELLVSPGHQTIDGRTVGELVTGDLYDSVFVVASDRVTYGDVATYDILPSGETGFYWANGILLDSTLH